MPKLKVCSKRGRTRVQPVRLTLGRDGDATMLTLQEVYASHIGKAVSRSVIARRALSALLEAVSNMSPEQAAAEAATVVRVARVAP